MKKLYLSSLALSFLNWVQFQEETLPPATPMAVGVAWQGFSISFGVSAFGHDL